MTNNKSGSGSRSDEWNRRGRSSRERSPSAEGSRGRAGASGRPRDESTDSRQRAVRPYDPANSQWNPARDASRNDGQRGGQAFISRKRAREDEALVPTNSETKFARLGARVVKDDVGQVLDLKPVSGAVTDANFWAHMPDATGAVTLKYHPGTAAGDATRAIAEQVALGASTTGELMSVILPVRRRPVESRLVFETRKPRSPSRGTNFYVPYGSKRREEEKDCDNCGKASHKTGACPKVSRGHGDTAVCPLCNVLPSVHMLDSDRVFSNTPDDNSRLIIRGCPALAQAWAEGLVQDIFDILVVDRLRKPTLRTRDKKNSIFELVFLVADSEHDGKMPTKMKGMWPYTKEDAVRYARELERFDEIGLENMPKSSLEAMTFAEIREAYNNGQISPQIYSKDERISRGVFAKRPSAEDKGKGKELAGDRGNAEMVDDQ